MPVLCKTLLVFATMGVLCFANITISATNPHFPDAGSTNVGVTGDPLVYGIQDFTLSDVGTAWTLIIDTNYGGPCPPSPVSPGVLCGGASGSIPSFVDGHNTLIMSDFLIQQGSNFFGVVFSIHDGYTPGNLYQASGFQLNPFTNFGPKTDPVMLQPGGSLVGTGTGLSAVSNPGCVGNGTGGPAHDCALYKVTDTFTAPANFFDPTQAFTITVTSADCDNEVIVYQHSSVVPEPRGLIGLVPALLLVGGYLRRRSLARVN